VVEPLYAFIVTLGGERRVLDTDYATPAAACQAGLVLQVELRTARSGDPRATVAVLPLRGAPAA
jgi:hypothetical protein